MKAKILIFIFTFVIAFAMASSVVSSLLLPFINAVSESNVTGAKRLKPLQKSADTVQTTIDTTQMDSLQLAIYKHNKAIDDSIRVDSIMKSKSNGIEAPVTYSADDSQIGRAHV